MFFMPRYIHRQFTYPGRKYRGFSVYLMPSDYPDVVNIQITFCSIKDQFSKARARAVLANKPILTLPVKHLPSTLAALEFKVAEMPLPAYASNRWAWVWKYFL